MTPVIELESVTKVFRDRRPQELKRILLRERSAPKPQTSAAVCNVSLRVNPGEAIAILGHNGSGKSTLLKLIAGTLQPTRGTITTRGRVVPLLELGAGFHPDLTGRENVVLNASVLGASSAQIRKAMDTVVDYAGLGGEIDKQLRYYSSGMAARLGFAVAMNIEADILLVDELLSVGDAEFKSRAAASLLARREQGLTIVLVTHSLPQAAGLCPKAMVMSAGRSIFNGPSGDAADALRLSVRPPT